MLSDSIAALRGVKSGLGHTVEGKRPPNSHSFVCSQPYTFQNGNRERNRAMGGTYALRRAGGELSSTDWSKKYGNHYAVGMIAECKKHGMKPVCGSYQWNNGLTPSQTCRYDPRSLWLGQGANELSYDYYRRYYVNYWYPAGFKAVQGFWDKTANYMGFTPTVSDPPCNVRREGGQSLVIEGPSFVILEGKGCNPL